MLTDNEAEDVSNGNSAAATNGSARVGRAGALNGTGKSVGSSSLVDSSAPNGKEVAIRQAPSDYFGHDREETTRIVLQTLSDMGYHEAAAVVSRDSGFDLESATVSNFRRAVLEGDWAEAERLLLGAATYVEADTHPRPDLILASGADRTLMRFWMRQQKFLELLEQRDTTRALTVLRYELTPLYQDTQKLHFLSSLLMCQDADELKYKAEWDGATGDSRRLLLSELARHISPSVMLPEHRLAVLFQQVKDGQIGTCLYHTTDTSPSLYSDHCCDKEDFPSQVLRDLDRHLGEVWQLKFSNDGKRMASCGLDRFVIIWDTKTFDLEAKLESHEGGVGNLAWSPDDKLLVTCGRDRHARIWDTNSGLLCKVLERFDEPVSCCAWAPDGRSFVVGSFDRDRALCQYTTEGEKIYTWTRKHRTEDLTISPDGHWMVAMDDQKQIHVYNFVTRELEYDMPLLSRPTSVSISRDSAYLLINKQDGEIILVDIAMRGKVVREYHGAQGGPFLIRSAFGGADESFVISGSEDGNVYIWHKNVGMHLFKLEAHMPRCNSVAWSPIDPCLFASCGDDGRIKIWSNKARGRYDIAVLTFQRRQE